MAVQTSPRFGGWNVQDALNLIAAVLLFISPWALRYSGDMMAARTAWISAIVIGIFSIAALSQFAEWEEWVTMVLGVWLIVAPWILGFAAVSHAMAAFIVLGAVVAVLSASELWMVHNPTAMAK